jgi:hypothetical protein
MSLGRICATSGTDHSRKSAHLRAKPLGIALALAGITGRHMLRSIRQSLVGIGVGWLVGCGGATVPDDRGETPDGPDRLESGAQTPSGTETRSRPDSESRPSNTASSAPPNPTFGYGGSGGLTTVPTPDIGGRDGEGGTPTGSSAGGAPNLDVSCNSPVSDTLSPWVPREPDLDAPVSVVLAKARAVLAGSWHGDVTTPWRSPAAVVATFDGNGGYSAHCTQNTDYDGGEGCCRAFYYGSDRDSELKQWSLDSVTEGGMVSGKLDVAFCSGDESCYLPAWQGLIEALEFDASENRVRFEFWRDDGYGPVLFDLERD